jgi:hypothetical protein
MTALKFVTHTGSFSFFPLLLGKEQTSAAPDTWCGKRSINITECFLLISQPARINTRLLQWDAGVMILLCVEEELL